MNSAEFRTGHVLRQAGAVSWPNAASWIALRGAALQLVLTLLATVSAAVVGTAIYRELRLAHEGIELERVPSMPGARIHTPG